MRSGLGYTEYREGGNDAILVKYIIIDNHVQEEGGLKRLQYFSTTTDGFREGKYSLGVGDDLHYTTQILDCMKGVYKLPEYVTLDKNTDLFFDDQGQLWVANARIVNGSFEKKQRCLWKIPELSKANQILLEALQGAENWPLNLCLSYNIPTSS